METMTTQRVPTGEKFIDHYMAHVNRDFRPASIDYDAQRAKYEDPKVAE